MRKIFSMALLAVLGLSASAQIRINEVMQSNIDGLYVDGDFPDSWIELKNTGGNDIDLKGWGVSVKDKYKKAYVINESCVVAPGGFLLLYCDKEEKGLHTDFRVDSGESSVYLWNPSGELAEEMKLAKMPAPEISYGVTTEGGLGYFVTATPGAENVSVVSDVLLPNPEISPVGGVFSSPVTVTVQLPADARLPEGAVLCVTTDGSEPTMKDAVADAGLHTLQVSASTPVRARYVSADALSPRSMTQSYIFPGRELTMPVVCLTTDPELLYGEDRGMLYGDHTDPNSNVRQDWRRPIQVEYYDLKDGKFVQAINQLGETAIQGHSSRKWSQRSLKIYSNKRFGKKGYEYTFWEDKPNVTSVPSFSIRNAGNNFNGSHVKDSFIQTLFGHGTKTVDYQAYRPVVAYINGEYYGLIDLRERSNEDFVSSNYDGLEDIAMVEDWWELVTDESAEPFRKFNDAYMSDATTYEEMCSMLDVNSFVTQLLADAFGFNVDTPHNNIIQWMRLDVANPRWRWILKDLDNTGFHSYVNYNYNDYLRRQMGDLQQDWWANSERGTALFRKMLSFPEFSLLCADRFVAFNGDFLNPEHSMALLTSMYEEIKDEYIHLVEKYPENFAHGNLQEQYVKDMADYYSARGDVMLKQYQEELGLGEIVGLDIVSEPKHKLTVNGHLTQYPVFKGKAYADRPVKLRVDDLFTYRITSTDASGKSDVQVVDDCYCNFVPEAGMTYSIEIVNRVGVDEIVGEDDVPAVYYTADGLCLGGEPTESGIYIRRQGRKVEKIVISK